jgi:predicted branched-subunit amino acid permease
MESNRDIFMQGFKHGIPIGLGYFAVAFSLGIAARDYGFSAFQGFFASLITYASAGQYMGFALYATNTTLAELVLLMFIINARYILMGFTLNQRMPEGTPLRTRLLVGTCITDEIFGANIGRPGAIVPEYTYGIATIAPFLWGLGTALGIIAGNGLPARVVSALSVALYGMFIAIIVPPCKKDRAVLIAVLASFLLSYLLSAESFLINIIPIITDISSGTRIIVLTIVISAVAAVCKPIRLEEEQM